jgi:hypothetical protein
MHLRYDHNCCNSIDLIDDETGEVIGCIHGPNEGGGDITDEQIDLADDICNAYNDR